MRRCAFLQVSERVGGTGEDDASFDVSLLQCLSCDVRVDELQATGCSSRTSFVHGVIVLASGWLPRLGRLMWSSGSGSTGTVSTSHQRAQ